MWLEATLPDERENCVMTGEYRGRFGLVLLALFLLIASAVDIIAPGGGHNSCSAQTKACTNHH